MGQVGDKPGHPFRGNQHKSGGGRGFANPAAMTAKHHLVGPNYRAAMREQTVGEAYKAALDKGQAERDAKFRESRKSLNEDRPLRGGKYEHPERASSEDVSGAKPGKGPLGGYRTMGAGQPGFGPAPDLDHLSRENKIPAKIADVPVGGKGVFEKARAQQIASGKGRAYMNEQIRKNAAPAKKSAMSPTAIAERIRKGTADKVDLSIAKSHADSGNRALEGALVLHDAREATRAANRAAIDKLYERPKGPSDNYEARRAAAGRGSAFRGPGRRTRG